MFKNIQIKLAIKIFILMGITSFGYCSISCDKAASDCYGSMVHPIKTYWVDSDETDPNAYCYIKEQGAQPDENIGAFLNSDLARCDPNTGCQITWVGNGCVFNGL